MTDRLLTDLPGELPGVLPGDATRRARVAQMLRVDHAGEYGATRIYRGQLAVLGRGASGETLRHMLAQEEEHLRVFSGLVADRRVRPTALLPLWHVAGFALGAVSAALGEKAAMACTVAVEEAIDAHYSAQEAELAACAPEDASLADAAVAETVARFRAEELEHRDIGLAHGAEQAPGYRLMSAAIKTACRVAIALSERV